MEKGNKDKSIKAEDTKQKFFYPALGITIEAETQEEADKKAAHLAQGDE